MGDLQRRMAGSLGPAEAELRTLVRDFVVQMGARTSGEIWTLFKAGWDKAEGAETPERQLESRDNGSSDSSVEDLLEHPQDGQPIRNVFTMSFLEESTPGGTKIAAEGSDQQAKEKLKERVKDRGSRSELMGNGASQNRFLPAARGHGVLNSLSLFCQVHHRLHPGR